MTESTPHHLRHSEFPLRIESEARQSMLFLFGKSLLALDKRRRCPRRFGSFDLNSLKHWFVTSPFFCSMEIHNYWITLRLVEV
jgi:hypothetical protein